MKISLIILSLNPENWICLMEEHTRLRYIDKLMLGYDPSGYKVIVVIDKPITLVLP